VDFNVALACDVMEQAFAVMGGKLIFFHVKFEVLAALNMMSAAFWDVMSCGVVGRYRRVRGTCLLLLKDGSVCCVFTDRSVQIRIGGRDVGMGWTFQDTCDFCVNGIWVQYKLLHVTFKIFNLFVTSGTYVSHLQRVFSSPLG
jgi:hypothetical protein